MARRAPTRQALESLHRGFDAGNYANAYTSEDFDTAWHGVREMRRNIAYRDAFLIGFFSTYELHEMPSYYRLEWQEAMERWASIMQAQGIAVGRDEDESDETGMRGRAQPRSDNRSEWLKPGVDFEGRVIEVLMHKYKYTRWRAEAVIKAAWGNDRGPLDVLRGQGRSPSAVAEFLYCRSGPQPKGVRAAMERVTGPTVKVRPGTRSPNNPTRDVHDDGAFCKGSR